MSYLVDSHINKLYAISKRSEGNQILASVRRSELYTIYWFVTITSYYDGLPLYRERMGCFVLWNFAVLVTLEIIWKCIFIIGHWLCGPIHCCGFMNLTVSLYQLNFQPFLIMNKHFWWYWTPVKMADPTRIWYSAIIWASNLTRIKRQNHQL